MISDSISCLKTVYFNGTEYVFSNPHHNYTYAEATNACTVLNASLTSITTNQEQDFLVTHMTRSVNHNHFFFRIILIYGYVYILELFTSCLFTFVCRDRYWIGLEFQQGAACGYCTNWGMAVASDGCLRCRAKWSWQNGEAMTDSNGVLLLDNWYPTEPDGGQSCAILMTHVLTAGQWGELECTREFGFICKEGTDHRPCLLFAYNIKVTAA